MTGNLNLDDLDLLEGALLLADLLNGHDGDEDDGGEGDHPAPDIGPGGVRVVRVRVAVIVESREQEDALKMKYFHERDLAE